MNRPATILGLDPSSTRTGYALLATTGPTVLEMGVLRPRQAAPVPDRLLSITMDLFTLLDRHRPGLIAIEITSGHQAGRNGPGRMAGLGVYGMAVGAVLHAAWTWVGHDEGRWPPGATPRVVTVTENHWTRSAPKARRQMNLAAAYPDQRRAILDDHDAADALGVADWCLWHGLSFGLDDAKIKTRKRKEQSR